MEISFEGKRALVTGAGKGIGKALTLKLVECGAEVVAVSRTRSDLDALEAFSPKIQTLCLDVGNWEDTKCALSQIEDIDLLVNNAGIMDVQEYGTYTEEDIDRTLNINVKAIVNITQLLAEGMKTRGTGGAVVNVSSMMGLSVAHSYGVYCASKGAVVQLTRSMAVEYGPYNIRVNAVNPTVVNTRMTQKEGFFDKGNEFANAMRNRTPLKRFAEPEDVINVIIFLLSDKAAMVNGVCLPVDGGMEHLFT